MRRLKSSRKYALGVLGLCFCISLFFQNCSQVAFQAILDPAAFTSNNGTGYTGRGDSNYYRFTPDFTCEKKPTYVAQINSVGSTYTLTENKKLMCGAVQQVLDPTLIDFSVFENDLIGYQEGIYDGTLATPAQIPANLVEVWCRDTKDTSAIETITHFDHTTNLAVTRIYTAQGEVNDFNVARTIGSKTVTVKDQNGFELVVHRDQPAPEVGLFTAELQINIKGKVDRRQTYCRLGGSLDPKVWPAKQIVDLNVSQFLIAPDLNSLSFTSSTGTGIENLFTVSSEGSSLNRSAPSMLQSGVASFQYTPDSKALIYNGDARLAGFIEIFKATLDGSTNLQLSQNQTLANQAANSKFVFSADGNSVIYSDGVGEYNGSRQKNINIVSLTGGEPKQLSQVFSAFDDAGTNDFQLSKSTNRVVFFSGQIYPDLFSEKLDGTDRKTLNPPDVLTGWTIESPVGETTQPLFDWFNTISIVGAGDYAIVRARLVTNYQYYAVAVDGSGSQKLPAGQWWEISSPSGQFAVLASATESVLKRSLFNLGTGISIQLPALNGTSNYLQAPDYKQIDTSPLFFTIDSSALISSMNTADGKVQAVAISTSVGTLTPLCQGVKSTAVFVKEIKNQKFAVLTYDSDSQILNVYTKTGRGDCVKVNSAISTAVTANSFLQVSLSPDGTKLLATLGELHFDSTTYKFVAANSLQQILYVPLNGGPSIVVNTPVFEAATVTDAHFLNDSKTVSFSGDQISPNDFNIFLWNSP